MRIDRKTQTKHTGPVDETRHRCAECGKHYRYSQMRTCPHCGQLICAEFIRYHWCK